MSGLPPFWVRIAKLGGLPADVTPDVLRHSFASLAADLGYSEPTIAALVGHKGQTITSRYVHAADAILLAAADAVANRTAGLMGEAKPVAAVVPLRAARELGMSGIAFDTLKLAERLEAAGMPPQQARGVAAALADTMSGSLVTREYLDLRLGETEARLRGESALVRTEMAALRAELWKWAGGAVIIIIIIIGAVAALVRLLH